MENINANPCSQQGEVADNVVGSSCLPAEEGSKGIAVRRRSDVPDSTTPTKRAKYQTGSSDEPESPDTSPQSGKKCGHCNPARSRYIYMKYKAKEMNSYCNNLNIKMKELVKTNLELARLLLSLLEAVDIPGSPKLVGSVKHLGEGETKKAVLERINLLLQRAGLSNFPGPLGEILYNDLFMELRNAQQNQ